jgi:two-component system sensor histidine kinase DesK
MITDIPEELKIGYLITILLMLFLVLLVVFFVVLYDKRKAAHQRELKLKKTAFENQLLSEQVEKQKALMKERERFSSDLHDEVGAGISALKLRIEFIKRLNVDAVVSTELDELLETAQELNNTMREMLWNLSSEDADLEQLHHFIAKYGRTFFEKTDIHFSSHYLISQGKFNIDFNQKKQLIACLKEIFNNIYKHSKAQKLKVRFSKDASYLMIDVEDDGIGFENEIKAGNGLRSLARRMQQLGGTMQIISKSRPTLLQLQFPIKKK